MIVNLTYDNFVWTFKSLKKNGFDVMKYYTEDEDYFILQFHNEGVTYKCKVFKLEISEYKSRYDEKKHENIIGIPVITNTMSVLSIENFRKDELFDYMRVISFD